MKHWASDDKEELLRYNALDVVATARVYRGLRREPEFKEKRVQRLYRLHLELARIAAEMHTHGIRIDKMMRRYLAWGLAKEYRERERSFLKAVDIDGFECQPNHLRALIFKSAAVGKYAKLGRFSLPDPLDKEMYVDPKEMDTISVGEDQLTLLLIDPGIPEELKQIIELYWAAQEVWKRRSTFVMSKRISNAIGRDGRIHPEWNSAATDTGRFAGLLMTVPKMMRCLYVAGKGNVLISADYSQLELRVMAAVSGDKVLAKALSTGDVYTEDAKAFFGLPATFTKKDVKPEARQSAKTIHLGKQYGAGKKTVFRQCLKQMRSMKWEACSLLCDSFDKLYDGTVQYWGREEVLVGKQGYSASRILDRRRYYPAKPERTEVANYPIQSTASDVKNLALVELDKKLKKYVPRAHLVLDLHDALGAVAPQRDRKDVEELFKETMEREFEIEGKKYVFPVEIGSGERWSDIK